MHVVTPPAVHQPVPVCLPQTPHTCTPLPPVPRSKRPLQDNTSCSPLSRRRRLDTPTRHAIGRLQPSSSPIVAVCVIIGGRGEIG